MGSSQKIPQWKKYWSSPAIGATATQTIHPPLDADAYQWMVVIATDSGTSPTIDVALQISPDGGTTFWSVSRFAQVTTSDTTLYKVHSNGPVTGQAAAVATVADTGGVVETNFTPTETMRIKATIGGTSPGFATFEVWMCPVYKHNAL